MKVLILGGNGQLGSDCVKVFEEKGHDVHVHTRTEYELDSKDADNFITYLETKDADLIINCTAHHNVDECNSTNPYTDFMNIQVPATIADYCEANKKKMVHISTDYVYGQEDQFKPYTELIRPSPINYYGWSKVWGEDKVKEVGYVLRVAALYGLNPAKGKGNFVETMLRLGHELGEVAVTTDEVTTPTFTLDVARQMYKIVEEKIPFGEYHCTCQGETTWFMFAKKIFWEFGMRVKTCPVANNHFKRKVMRPFYSVLENKKLADLGVDIMPHWEDSLKEYTKLKKEMIENETKQE